MSSKEHWVVYRSVGYCRFSGFLLFSEMQCVAIRLESKFEGQVSDIAPGNAGQMTLIVEEARN